MNYFDKKQQGWADSRIADQATENNGEKTCNR